MTLLTGGCLCGACRHAGDAPVIDTRLCHCSRCQKATGAPFHARVLVPLAALTITGPVAWYYADTGVRRGFCPSCGATLFSERAAAGTVGIAMGTLDHPERHTPGDHIRTEAMQPWLMLADNAPRHAQGPPD